MHAKPTCPHCQSPLVQADQLAPGKWRCRSCNRPFRVAEPVKAGHHKRKDPP